MNSDHFSTLWTLRVLSVLRIFTGLDLLQHGTAKILGFPEAAAARFANLQINSLAEQVG